MRNKPRVGEILVRAGVIDEMQLRAALGEQASWGQRIGATLVKMGLIEERELVQALAQQLQIPVVQLEGKRVQQEVLDLLPAELAEKHMCLPLFIKDHAGVNQLFIGMDDPCDLTAIDEVTFRTGLEVRPVLVSPSELCEAIDRFYHRGGLSPRHANEARTIPIELDASRSAEADGTEGAEGGVPIVHESLFRDLSDLQREAAGAAPAPEGARGSAVDETAARGAGASETGAESANRAILRALCELLSEKGLIDRDELHARVRSIAAVPATPGSQDGS